MVYNKMRILLTQRRLNDEQMNNPSYKGRGQHWNKNYHEIKAGRGLDCYKKTLNKKGCFVDNAFSNYLKKMKNI